MGPALPVVLGVMAIRAAPAAARAAAPYVARAATQVAQHVGRMLPRARYQATTTHTGDFAKMSAKFAEDSKLPATAKALTSPKPVRFGDVLPPR
jgi:hypothetical protein